MKTLDAAFQSHLESGNTTLCSCLVITLKETGAVEGYTDNVEPLKVAGVLCNTISTYTGKALEARQDYSVADMQLQASLDAMGIQAEDLADGKYDGAAFVMYLVNYGAADLDGFDKVVPAGQYDILHRGWIGDTSTLEPVAELETRSLMQVLQSKTGEVTSPICRTSLGRPRCGVNLSTYTVTGTVDTVLEAKTAFNDLTRTEPANTYSYGVIRWATGAANESQEMEVKRSTSGGDITLSAPLRKPIEAGDAYAMHRGCNRLATTCKGVFDNIDNMRAEIFLIGEDQNAKFGRQ